MGMTERVELFLFAVEVRNRSAFDRPGHPPEIHEQLACLHE
jgi:hypothetical protein